MPLKPLSVPLIADDPCREAIERLLEQYLGQVTNVLWDWGTVEVTQPGDAERSFENHRTSCTITLSLHPRMAQG